MSRHSDNFRPDLGLLTLRFQDPALEKEYQDTYPAGMRNVTRFGLVLAIVLFALFGFLEVPATAEMMQKMWTTRLAVIGGLLFLLAISHTDFYYRHLQLLVSIVVVAMAGSYCALLSTTDGTLYHEAYTFILLMIAAYTVLALQFLNVLVVCLAIGSIVTVYSVFSGGGISFDEGTALVYVAAALVMVIVGSYMFDQQRRTAFYVQKQLKAEREESYYLALHDPLTGLANRRLLMEKLRQAMARSNRSGHHNVLMFIDLDGFKQVNDVYGHDAGDAMLVEIAQRLKSAVREADTLARIGGDEFVMLFEDVQDRNNAQVVASKVVAQFEKPVDVQGNEVQPGASIGIAIHPDNGNTADELLRSADDVMYVAKKRKGTNFIFFDEA